MSKRPPADKPVKPNTIRARRARELRKAGWIYFRGWLPPEATHLVPEWDQDDCDGAGEAVAAIILRRSVTSDTA